MKFLKRKNKKSSNAPTSTNIQTLDSISVYTNAVHSEDLPHSLSLSSSEKPGLNSNKHSMRTSRRNKKTTNRIKAKSSYDKKILEVEAKLKSQLRQLASGSYDEHQSDNEKENGYSNSMLENRNMRLMSTAGVLLFDGLAEDIPDDSSLQSIIRKERQSNASQYYQNDPSNLITNNTRTNTRFVLAPNNYDPVETGFMNRTSASYYETDDDENDEETECSSSYNNSNSNSTRKSASASKRRNRSTLSTVSTDSTTITLGTCMEPSIEVVVNELSALFKL